MESNKALYIYNEFKDQSIDIWLDGGWGVDALLEKKTRDHSDLDIVVQQKDLNKAIEVLNKNEFVLKKTSDMTPWNFVMENRMKEKIDFHVINIDSDGVGIYGPKDNEQYYSQEALEYGYGLIDHSEVRVLSPEYQIASHSGYILKEKDVHDIKLLCHKFLIGLPQNMKK